MRSETHFFEELTVQVTALAHGGEVVTVPVDNGTDRRKVFTRGGIPGETLQVQIVEEHKNYKRGILVQIIEPSSDRCTSPCPYFGRCGGCDYQFMPIALQRKLKTEMVTSMLQRQAGVAPKNGVVLLGEHLPAFEYRTRIGLHISPSIGAKPAQLGFFRERSGEVVDIANCLISTPLINATIKTLRTILSQIEGSIAGVVVEEIEERVFVAAKLREDALELVDHEHSPALQVLRDTFPHCCVLDRERPIYSQVNHVAEDPKQRSTPVGKFSQINSQGNELLKQKVCELVNHPEVTDLYAGAGNFSIPLALMGRSVHAVELDHELVRAGKLAAFRAGVPEHRLTFVEASCEQYIRSHALKRCVVLDPPRSGAEAVVKTLRPDKTSQIIYVSCSLPTLCRDTKTLISNGYSLQATWVVDMFSQTHHVETISHFQRL